METYSGMSADALGKLLHKMRDIRVAVLGDICLDAYWLADMTLSEISRETPHFPLPIVEERMSPGAGGNVAANLSALMPKKVWAVSAVGRDWRGDALTALLDAMGVDTSFVISGAGMVTNAYIKPMRRGISRLVYEDPRLDFANYAPISEEAEAEILRALKALEREVDVLCVSDQMRYGVVTPRVRALLSELGRGGLPIVVDSRDRIGEYAGVILKPNEVEGAKAAGIHTCEGLDDCEGCARALSRRQDCPVIMTMGERGAFYAKDDHTCHIPARTPPGEIDIVGAGDTFLSGFSMALAAGAEPHEAAFVAGLSSEVTIQKIGTTGVATPTEIMQWYGRRGI